MTRKTAQLETYKSATSRNSILIENHAAVLTVVVAVVCRPGENSDPQHADLSVHSYAECAVDLTAILRKRDGTQKRMRIWRAVVALRSLAGLP